jgi:predicted secreted protein
MSLALGIALYFLIWWTILFAVLPFGVRTQAEEGVVVPGTPGSAPVRPRLLRLFLVNSLVAAVVFGCVWAAIVYRVLPLDTFPLLQQ